ncbi:MAG: hypothetical protein WEC59_03450 [Salibacteraceae bacterium]
MIRTIFIFAVCIFTVSQSWAQVKLSGHVQHQSEKLSDVTIKILENGKVLKTLSTNRKGGYETEIPFNRQYVLSFHKAFMYPVSIAIDTRIPLDMVEESIYEVPLNMRMYHRYAGIPEGPFKKIIGTIKKTGQGSHSFSFVPDTKVIKSMRSHQALSLELDESDEKPIEHPLQESIEMNVDEPLVEEPKNRKAVTTSKLEEPSKSEVDVISKPDPFDHQSDRYEVIKASKQLEISQIKQAVDDQQSTDIELGEAQHEHVATMKGIKSENEIQRQSKEAFLADAKSAKFIREKDLMPFVRSGYAAEKNIPKVISFKSDSGYWIEEEKLMVEQNGVRNEYVKTTYDWLLFTHKSFTKNNLEISEKEYEQIRKLVDS